MHRICMVFAAVGLLGGVTSHAQDSGWPKELQGDRATVVVYQPQIESFSGNALEAMAAVSVKAPETDNVPVFGAIWMEARLDTNRDTRMATIRDITVTDVRFADATEENKDKLAAFIESSVKDSAIAISVDEILADLDQAETDIVETSLKHDPPKIMLSTTPAMLVSIDGEPVFQDIPDSKYERVVNTPFLIVRDGRAHYLYAGGNAWYSARTVEGPWARAPRVPGDIAAMVEPAEADAAGDVEIIVATEPTELIVSDGPPSWKPVEGMDLLYMDNTDSDAFLELSTQSYYVLLSGRWYRGDGMIGNLEWTHVPNDELPHPFSDIPEDSVNAAVLAQVAGTQQARDAVLDNAIPQTAAIDRDDDSFSVKYDGEPEFGDIEDVRVQYALNTPSSVFKVGSVYYACDQGVWYTSPTPEGPWRVATSVPDVIYDIPVSNPHHNVTYVRVYDVTPQVVYVGYTPSYFGSYYYHGAVVYGTGWYYTPWYGPYYYPRYPTWGFHVSYNPWTGWGFGVSWGYGPFRITVGGYPGYGHAWFGPGGYRPYPRPYVGGGYRKTTINIDNSININVGDRNRPQTRPNLYDRPENRVRQADRSALPSTREARVASDLRNNVVADRSGNVYQRNDDGRWNQREGGEWKSPGNLDRAAIDPARVARDTPASRPSTGAVTRPSTGAVTRPSTGVATRPGTMDRSAAATRSRTPTFSSPGGAARPQLERDFSARQHGAQRAQNFQRSGGGGRPGRR